ncbi:hypothetical protein J2Z50_000564 [Ensifer mexicanus]|nr:hypothetical protein [Sinorhizobium mexicanum]
MALLDASWNAGRFEDKNICQINALRDLWRLMRSGTGTRHHSMRATTANTRIATMIASTTIDSKFPSRMFRAFRL